MYTERTFNLPGLAGISAESVQAHLGLYAGYVKNLNTLLSTKQSVAADAYACAEVMRRLAFEYDGVRLHERYFEQWEGSASPLSAASALAEALAAQFGSVEDWEKEFRTAGMMRGVGWMILYYDRAAQMFHHAWIDQHHQGLLAGADIIFALDVWEHAYLAQFGTGGRAAYIDAFFKNLNWSVVEKRFG